MKPPMSFILEDQAISLERLRFWSVLGENSDSHRHDAESVAIWILIGSLKDNGINLNNIIGDDLRRQIAMDLCAPIALRAKSEYQLGHTDSNLSTAECFWREIVHQGVRVCFSARLLSWIGTFVQHIKLRTTPALSESILLRCLSDNHLGDRVFLVMLETQRLAVLKSRSSHYILRFNEFIHILESNSICTGIETLEILEYDSHFTLSAYLTPPSNSLKPNEICFAVGRAIALLTILRCSDLHTENLLHSSDKIVVVDTETLMQPAYSGDVSWSAKKTGLAFTSLGHVSSNQIEGYSSLQWNTGGVQWTSLSSALGGIPQFLRDDRARSSICQGYMDQAIILRKNWMQVREVAYSKFEDFCPRVVLLPSEIYRRVLMRWTYALCLGEDVLTATSLAQSSLGRYHQRFGVMKIEEPRLQAEIDELCFHHSIPYYYWDSPSYSIKSKAGQEYPVKWLNGCDWIRPPPEAFDN